MKKAGIIHVSITDSERDLKRTAEDEVVVELSVARGPEVQCAGGSNNKRDGGVIHLEGITLCGTRSDTSDGNNRQPITVLIVNAIKRVRGNPG